MIKYLSSDVKTAIEDYKSPFTRIKIQLNPAKLGDVDLTIVQRGKNLHVSLSSNTTAINTLSINANELKTQLNNSGINNATLNFSSSSDNSGSNQQQGQREHEKQAHEEYNYFDNEEANEEVLSSLEIVVPRYI
jgi:flagellar hook-length control protein FliK